MVERGSSADSPEAYWFQDTGLVASIGRQSLPSDCPFQYRELRWCQHQQFAQNELLEVEKPTPKAKRSRSYRFRW